MRNDKNDALVAINLQALINRCLAFCKFFWQVANFCVHLWPASKKAVVF